MASRAMRLQFGLILLVLVVYLGTLFRNLNESGRRSLELTEKPVGGDYIAVSIRVVSLDPGSLDMTVRLNFRLHGEMATDLFTPAVDLTIFLNTVRGPQQIELPRGRRINPIDAVFSLEGNANQYPFDRYQAAIRMLVAKRASTVRKRQPQASPAANNPSTPVEADDDFLMAPPKQETVPIVSSLSASIPGLKFAGESFERPGRGLEGFNLAIRRADNVMIVSILIMILMMSLAMSVFMMSLQALTGDRIELLPLSLSVSLLFGLPALRNAQPAVPPLGAFGDYLSFLWAEQIVAASSVILIWTWLLRQRRAR